MTRHQKGDTHVDTLGSSTDEATGGKNEAVRTLQERENIGREIADLPEHVIYQFSCACGWWGIARIPRIHSQANCAGCGVAYRQWQDTAGSWRLSVMAS